MLDLTFIMISKFKIKSLPMTRALGPSMLATPKGAKKDKIRFMK